VVAVAGLGAGIWPDRSGRPLGLAVAGRLPALLAGRWADRAGRGAVVLHHPILLGTEADLEQIALAVRKIHAYAGRLR